ncbi:MAG: cell division protein ZapA [Alphaproteobacteria bacterium]
MAQVSITINGRAYEIACDDGQESHLQELGRYVDSRVAELSGALGQIGDARLLVMAGLLIADELGELRDSLAAEDDNRAAAGAAHDQTVASGLAAAADRVNRLAARLAAT